jgi:ferric-dicitrate binding protein FerR (iron transport regulator)
MLENTSLSDIIAALGPYYDGKIVLLNKAAGRERLNAAIDLNRLDGWLSGLAKTHSLHLVHLGDVTLLW